MTGTRRGLAFGAAIALSGVLLASCSHRSSSASHIADPAGSIAAKPDYTQSCSPSGADTSVECTQVVLQSIDNARAKEHLRPMALPSDFGKLSIPQQLFVSVNRERVDRGLQPVAALSSALTTVAERGASTGNLPPDPGSSYRNASTEWIGAVANALDAVYQWMYLKGSNWADRHLILDDFGSDGTLVMGASFDPTGDSDPTDKGGTSLGAVLAVTATPGTSTYTWTQAQADLASGTLRPRGGLPSNASATHIADPPQTVRANPDFTRVCAPSGLDSSATCIQSALEAIDHARAAEGVKAMVLPAGFASMTVAQQLFVAVNLERVDRGLPPFRGLTAGLNANAQRGADIANDPPDPGKDYDVVDTEWAGGSSNGLDAVYGWMYDDGIGSGNLDCPKGGGAGCWGHRHGILDNFGTVGTLVMGAALNPTSDTGDDKGGPSMAASLAITSRPVAGYTYAWAQVTGSAGPSGQP
ncbi:MAG TPA: hypothetical protein VGK51_00825 [Actinomycetota bacterium]